ncbi:MAG TPA: chemotaxis protein CheB, partial [Gaiellaceae bacterium]|nr:chemotaxis protein CheB [Gaiellaceae bacterium]
GGVEALTTLVAGLPEDLEAAVAVVLHLHPAAESRLAEILDRAGPLPAQKAEDGAELRPGRIYVAPPNRHLLVRRGRCAVVHGPHENGLRPSIDVLFRSVAVAVGPRATAIVLSGTRDDGVAGASAIGRRGGCVFVQDPDDALFPGMPAETVARDHPDRVLPLAELAGAVAGRVARLSQEVAVSENGRDEMSLETEYATLDAEALERDGPPGEVSSFSCPACGGVLWEVEDGDLLRFRCRVGHAFTAEGALEAEGEELETALWTALRALQERAQLSERIARRMERSGAARSRERFEQLAREAREQADTIRRVLAGRDAREG